MGLDPAIGASLALLGAYHGLNPGMGWLFALALGRQERSRGAVIQAFGPIALGHALSVGVVIVLVTLLHRWLDAGALKILGAVVLINLGIYKLVAPLSHPRWVGMRVGKRDLVTWSFLMSSAHGAGLMLVPLILRLPDAEAGPHSAQAATIQLAAVAESGATVLSVAPALLALGVHTVAMFAIMALIAVIVFEKVGLAILRRACFNLDRLWADALIAAGWVTLLV
jgi:hypothetical protein